MGRPADPFCWKNVDKLPNSRWRCKHCKEEFSGAASRIRIHLSGEGTDIGSCEAVPSHVREEALKRASKKRRRNSSLGESNDGISAANRTGVAAASANNGLDMATAFQVPSCNGDLSNHSNKSSEEECTTDVLVKFFMSQNLPVGFVKDPHFRTLITRFARHGVPSCLLRNDFVGIKRSVSNLEHEINEYMVMVKESWKTTGCTLIHYNLNEGRGNPSALESNSVVFGFYSPKGFIFVEGRQLDFSNGIKQAFKNHVLNLPIEDVILEVGHYGHPGCEFAQKEYTYREHFKISCVRQRVEELWMRICRETGWVRNLIQKSEKVYQYMLHSDKSYKCKGWRKLKVEKDADDTPGSSFARLRSIMQLEEGIKAWLSNVLEYEDHVEEHGVDEIINSNEFWSDGKELVKALTPLMGIIDLVDTLVPNVGYLQVEIEKAKRTLKTYYEREVYKYQMIRRSLYLLTSDLEWEIRICTYLSPVYDWRAKEGSPAYFINFITGVCNVLKELFLDGKDQKEKLEAEMKVYRDNNPFANLSCFERQRNHPVTLWNKYGDKFPLLRKCAIKLLSQPGSCMCNQVKKHITHFQGEDNFILRLNYHTMQQFTELGDRIYKPSESWYSYFDEVPASIPNQISPKKMVDGPHIGQIPAWMNQYISKSTDVISDGNCGYRAIAESLGLGQDNWREVRQKLDRELSSGLWDHLTVDTISKALNYYGAGPAPHENGLFVPEMGLLVASTFEAIFVVMGHNICCTYLPIYLHPGNEFLYVPEIVICQIPERSHFMSLSLTTNAPLPPVYNMWFSHPLQTTIGFADFLRERLNSYHTLRREEDRLKGEIPPIEIIDTW